MDENENRNAFQSIPEEPRRSINPIWIAVVVVLCIAAVAVGFIVEQQKAASQLTARNQELTASLTQTQGEVQTLSSKLNTLQTEQAQEKAAQAERERVERAARHAAAVRRARMRRLEEAKKAVKKDDPRWKQVQAELAAHQQAIASTQQDLSNTRTQWQNNLDSARNQLSGSIAKTHAELVALERKGERSYYEFDVYRGKRFQRVGPIEVSLRKTNAKHQFCNLKLLVNDRELTRKHITLYQPVLFYTSRKEQPVQLVINEISRHHMHGYVSAPKYQASQKSAANTGAVKSPATPAATTTTASATTTQPTVVDLRHRTAGGVN
ncbi:MAG: hypothetical protein P8Z30_03465 [Acidobacteriota bacterium]